MGPNGIAPMPTVGGNAANVGADISRMAPLASTWSGANNGVSIGQNVQASSGSSGSALDQFWGKVGSLGNESSHLIGEGLGFVAKNLSSMVKGTVNLIPSAYTFGVDAYDSITYGHQQTEILQKQANLGQQWRSGLISAQAYHSGMQDLTKDTSVLQDKLQGLTTRIGNDGKNVTSNTIDAASAVITIMTAGTASTATAAIGDVSAKTTADYLGGTAVDAVLGKAEADIGKIAVDKSLFSRLPGSMGNALKTAVTQTVLGAAKDATGAQIARAASVNLLLNYPLTYSMLSGSGHDIYAELQKGKYGDAVNTAAYNADILLLGGPVGHALFSLGGKALGEISSRIFGSTNFLDETSKLIGSKDPMGLYNAIKDNPELVKNFSALESTNVAASKGNVMGAVYRVINGLKAAGWGDIEQMSHDDFAKQVNNWANAQRMVIQDAIDRGIPKDIANRFAVGRWTAFDANRVADAIVANDRAGIPQTVEERLQAWQDFKNANPNAAFANNKNLDRQITTLIKQNDNANNLHQMISTIKAQFGVKGFGTIAKQIADRGYVVIKPTNLEAPFKEGTGVVKTAFSQGEDFFTKTVEPLPVLGYLGNVLVNAGLSPNASAQRVYDVFQANLADNLSKLDYSGDLAKQMNEEIAARAAKAAESKAAQETTSQFSKEELATMKAQGVTPEMLSKGTVSGEPVTAAPTQQAPKINTTLNTKTTKDSADLISKKLADYANGLQRTEHGIPLPPITDLRQMTTRDIQNALNVDAKTAKEVGSAIMDSMLEVPTSIKGLGNKIMDLNYKINPLAGRYSRVQGALRFAWNPFFAAKLSYKAEFLSQIESGGKFPTLLGTNNILRIIFPDKYAELDGLTTMLESKGVFGAGYMGEGANDTAAGYKQLSSHALLPGQKRSIAGLVSTMADKASMTPEQFVNNFPNETRDVTRMILQYDPRSNFLNSPMARTLNMAFFPFRFNLKVATIMARSLSRQPAVVQFAVIKGTMDAHKFLNSPQGMAWYSQNSDVIGLFKYFSPVETVSSILSALGLKENGIGALGELGGLPFGFIPQLLDAEGLTHFGQSYVSPKTGAVSQDYVPISSKGRLATAIQDFIGSLYTYPGSQIGFPSKTKIDVGIASGLTGANSKTDFNKVTPAITPQQQSFQQAVQAMNPQQPGQAQPATQQQSVRGIGVPNQTTPITTPIPKSTSSKLKKAQFKPALMPGQNQAGVL